MSEFNTKELEKISEIIQMIYAASTQPNKWQEVLSLLTDYFHLSTASFLEHAVDTKEPHVFNSFGVFDASAHSDYENYYGKVSPAMDNLHLYHENQVFTETTLVNHQQYVNSETYNDFFKKYDSEHLLVLVTERTHDKTKYFPLWRSGKVGHFNEKEINLARLLTPHLVQADKIAQQFQVESGIKATFEAVFKELKMGIVILKSSKISFINFAAESIFQKNDGLSIKQNRLCAKFNNDDKSLKKLLNITTKNQFELGKLVDRIIAIHRPSKQKPYILTMSLLDNSDGFSLEDKHILIMIKDPDTKHDDPINLIKNVYQLTQKEAEISNALCHNLSVAEISDLLNSNENAVRFHLKNTFQKLQVRRQSELVSMLLKGPLGHLL